jgi:cysteine desulfurase/selenocysteine lyase
LEYSGYLKKWDKVLLTITEHHSNIVPWLNLKEKIGIEVEFVWLKDDFSLDMEDFANKYDEKVKVISFTQVSNVTWEIYDLEKIGKLKREDTIFIVDASQSIPHIQVDVKKLNSDFLFFTAHKIMAETGLGVLWWKKEILQNMKSAFSGGWAINWVKEASYRQAALPSRFEPGTPHISGALTLLKALEYIESIWWYEAIETYDRGLIKYTLEKIKEISELHLVWWTNLDSRIWVFSFYINWLNSLDIADSLAEKNIAIRAGQHCAEPFALRLWISSTFRMSLYIYNTIEDIDKFFDELKKIIRNLD